MSSTSTLSRSLLLFLSILSFNPQYFRIQARHSCSGISLYYVLFNLIAFTEQFALGLHYLVDDYAVPNGIVNSPLTAGDWLNLLQHACVWLCSLLLFMTCLSLPPERRNVKRTVSAIYISFLLISVAPVIFEYFLPTSENSLSLDRRWFAAMFHDVHTIFIDPIATILAFISVFVQALETLSRPSPDALSTVGLAVQAIIFAVVAICWPLRMTIAPELWKMSLWKSIITWYQLVGWAAVDNAVFAFVQAILLWIAMRRGGELRDSTSRGEAVPLLQS